MVTDAAPAQTKSHWVAYPRFLLRLIGQMTDGSLPYYAWMVCLSALALVGANAWAQQVSKGMILTNMTNHVSWGLYIANFTFVVGVAAGGVMMVIPAYVYKQHKMHDVVIFGELLSVAAILMAELFVLVDLGRPDHFWHLIPGIGQFNWPLSMLSWDIIVLNGYLLLNMHICGYVLYMRFLGREPKPKWYVPAVFVSIFWAISIHTVTAFLYSGLGSRPLWNSALIAPRFLVSAFVAGPAFLIVTLHIIRRFTSFQVPERSLRILLSILRVTVILNLFMLTSEMFTEFRTGGHHTESFRYLFFGLEGHHALVPWIWTAVVLNVLAAGVLFIPKIRENVPLLIAACIATFVGVWIEKGMGLIVPGFIPSTLHELVEYQPSLIEWKVTGGIWAFGLLVYTAALKVAVPLIKPPATQESESGSEG